MDDKFVDSVISELEDVKKLFLSKHKQYATTDPLANFRTGAWLRYGEDGYDPMYETLKDYASKHIAHIYDFGVYGDKVDESLRDIIVYFLIALYMRRRALEATHAGSKDY